MENQQVEYDPVKAKEYIVAKFTEQGDFLQIVTPEELNGMVTAVMALDEQYMEQSGANEGAVYDDDAAFDYMNEQMAQKYPEHKMYMMRLVEDYMDYCEAYLDSIGAIEWE